MRPIMTDRQIKIMKLLGVKKAEDCDPTEKLFKAKITEFSYVIERANTDVTGLEAQLASSKEFLTQAVGKYIGVVEMVENYEMMKVTGAKPTDPSPAPEPVPAPAPEGEPAPVRALELVPEDEPAPQS